MLVNRVGKTAAFCCGLILALSVEASAEDWMQKSVKVAGGGTIGFKFPESWGKKPELDRVEGITTVRFGPYGPRKKPFFLVHLESVTGVEPVTAEDVKNMAGIEVDNHRRIAVETDIPVNDIEGPNVSGHYFSITDRNSKIGEFDYLTLAILRSGHLLVKCYFFSSDGAPDFGADAMQMMQSIKYTEPPPEPEKKKK
jgi:hypothetical protein